MHSIHYTEAITRRVAEVFQRGFVFFLEKRIFFRTEDVFLEKRILRTFLTEDVFGGGVVCFKGVSSFASKGVRSLL